MINQDYVTSAKRIRKLQAEQIAVPTDLSPDRISAKSLIKTATYVLTEMRGESEVLSKNQAVREKHDSNKDTLPRTVVVCRGPNMEYYTFAETKSKSDSQNITENGAETGGNKRGKFCYRLDGPNGPEQYYSLVLTLQDPGATKLEPNNQKLLNLQKEVTFGWKMNHPSFNRPILGPVYENEKGFQNAIYSPVGKELLKALAANELSATDIDSIAVQLCEAVLYAHHRGYIIQDMKLENVLINRDHSGKIAIRLIDFEGVHGNEFTSHIITTPHSESPELVLACSWIREAYKSKDYQETGPSLALKCADDLIKKLPATEITRLQAEYQKPHAKNDIWALGVMLYTLYNSDFPSVLPLPSSSKARIDFSKLLEPNREKRATAEEALSIVREGLGLGPVVAAVPVTVPATKKYYPPKPPVAKPALSPAQNVSIPAPVVPVETATQAVRKFIPPKPKAPKPQVPQESAVTQEPMVDLLAIFNSYTPGAASACDTSAGFHRKDKPSQARKKSPIARKGKVAALINAFDERNDSDNQAPLKRQRQVT